MQNNSSGDTDSTPTILRWISAVFFLIAGLFLYANFSDVMTQWQSKSWPSVKGRIIKGGYDIVTIPSGRTVEVVVNATADVEYHINEKLHRHTLNFHIGTYFVDQELKEKYTSYIPDAVVDVYYDPNETAIQITPDKDIFFRQRVALFNGFAPGAFEFMYFVGFFVVGGLFILLFAWLAGSTDSMRQARPFKQDSPVLSAGGDAGTEAPAVGLKFNPLGHVIINRHNKKSSYKVGGVMLFIAALIYLVFNHYAPDEPMVEVVSGFITILAILFMGQVYNLIIDKPAGIVEEEFGLFSFSYTRRYQLADYTRILMIEHAARNDYDHIRERWILTMASYSVFLAGKRHLPISGFPDRQTAEQYAEELGNYLGLSVSQQQ